MSKTSKTPPQENPPSMILFDQVAHSAAELFQASIALIVLKSAAGTRVAARAGRLSPAEARHGPWLCGRVIERNEPVFMTAMASDGPATEPNWLPTTSGIRFLAACPIRDADGNAAGALAIMDRRAHDFDDGDLACLASLAELLEQPAECLALHACPAPGQRERRTRGNRTPEPPQPLPADEVCILILDIDAPAGIDAALGLNAMEHVDRWMRDRVGRIVRTGDAVTCMPHGGMLLFIRGGEHAARQVAGRIGALLDGAWLTLALNAENDGAGRAPFDLIH